MFGAYLIAFTCCIGYPMIKFPVGFDNDSEYPLIYLRAPREREIAAANLS